MNGEAWARPSRAAAAERSMSRSASSPMVAGDRPTSDEASRLRLASAGMASAGCSVVNGSVGLDVSDTDSIPPVVAPVFRS